MGKTHPGPSLKGGEKEKGGEVGGHPQTPGRGVPLHSLLVGWRVDNPWKPGRGVYLHLRVVGALVVVEDVLFVGVEHGAY